MPLLSRSAVYLSPLLTSMVVFAEPFRALARAGNETKTVYVHEAGFTTNRSLVQTYPITRRQTKVPVRQILTHVHDGLGLCKSHTVDHGWVKHIMNGGPVQCDEFRPRDFGGQQGVGE